MGIIDDVMSMDFSLTKILPSTDFGGLLASAAEKYGIPDKLPILQRMLKVESKGNVRAKSKKGASGLMQLMPGTAKSLGVKDIYDPEENIDAGVRYFKQQLDTFGDDALALAAYNAGPNNVKKFKGIPPFKETQKYVSTILKASGNDLENMVSPISGKLTSGFNDPRGGRLHWGGDISAPAGSVFVSPTRIRITNIRDKMSNSPGGMVWGVDPQTGIEHKFHHVIPGVKVGDVIEAGQQLGTLSDISGSHLDYKMFDPNKGQYIDWTDKYANWENRREDISAMVADVSGNVTPEVKYKSSPEKEKTIGSILGDLASSMGPSEVQAAEPPSQRKSLLDEVMDMDLERPIPKNIPSASGKVGERYYPTTKVPIEGEVTVPMPVANQLNPPDFMTLGKAALVDDPVAKFKILAAARFPNEPEAWRNYFIDSNGDILYRQGNKAVREVPKELLERAKSFAAEQAIGRGPENVGAAVGATIGGIPGAAVGAGLGSMARQRIAEQYLGDKPKGTLGQAWTALPESATMALGTMPGKGIVGGYNASNRLLARPGLLGKLVGQEAPTINVNEVSRMIDLGRRYGVQLTAPEIINSPTLQGIWHSLATKPGSPKERIIQFQEIRRMPEIQQAIENELRNISSQPSVNVAGSTAQQVSRNIAEELDATRRNLSRPYYEAAYSNTEPIDIAPVVSEIDELMKRTSPQGPSRSSLENIKKWFYNKPARDPQTNEIIQEPLTDLAQLHNVRQDIDTVINGKYKGKDEITLNRSEIRRLSIIRKNLDEILKDASPEFAQADRLFAEYSKPLEEFLYGGEKPKIGKPPKSLIARIGDKGAQKLEDIPDMVFADTKEALRQTKDWFINNGYEAEWESLVRARLQNILDNIKITQIGEQGAKGARFAGKAFTDPDDIVKFQIALSPDKFRSLKDLMDLLRRTEKIVYNNSQTTPLRQAEKFIEESVPGIRGAVGTLGDAYATIHDILFNPRRALEIKKQKWAIAHSDVVLDAFLNPDPVMAQRLAQIRRMPDTPKKVIEFGSLVSSVVGRRTFTEGEKNVQPNIQD